jgi:hypothetical protein
MDKIRRTAIAFLHPVVGNEYFSVVGCVFPSFATLGLNRDHVDSLSVNDRHGLLGFVV